MLFFWDKTNLLLIGKILTVRFENAENLEKADHAFIIFFREPITVLQNHIIEMMKDQPSLWFENPNFFFCYWKLIFLLLIVEEISGLSYREQCIVWTSFSTKWVAN